MPDRIVYVCGCEPAPHYEMPRWRASSESLTCSFCHQPVTAINIDRLLGIELHMHNMAYGPFAFPNTVVKWQERAKILLKEADHA